MTREERARLSAETMFANDNASREMGFKLDHVGPGWARMSFKVEERHLNGHGICHGGLIFALADSAFAFACNSRNQQAVAQFNSISYIAPGKLGDRLTASAEEAALKGRSGVYDVRVSSADGTTVALFRGCSRILQGAHFDEAGPDAAKYRN